MCHGTPPSPVALRMRCTTLREKRGMPVRHGKVAEELRRAIDPALVSWSQPGGS